MLQTFIILVTIQTNVDILLDIKQSSWNCGMFIFQLSDLMTKIKSTILLRNFQFYPYVVLWCVYMSRGIWVKSRCVIIGKGKQIILDVGYVKVDNEHVIFNPTTFKWLVI